MSDISFNELSLSDDYSIDKPEHDIEKIKTDTIQRNKLRKIVQTLLEFNPYGIPVDKLEEIVKERLDLKSDQVWWQNEGKTFKYELVRCQVLFTCSRVHVNLESDNNSKSSSSESKGDLEQTDSCSFKTNTSETNSSTNKNPINSKQSTLNIFPPNLNHLNLTDFIEMLHDFLELHRIKHTHTSILIKLKDLNSILFNEVINNSFFMKPILNRKNISPIEETKKALAENYNNISEAIGIVLTDICLSPDFNPQQTAKIQNFNDLKLWEFLIHEAGLNCLKIGRISDLSQKSPDLYIHNNENDLWKKCVTTQKLAHTDYYEYRKLKNGKNRIRSNMLYAVSRSSVVVQINDPGHGKMDPIERLKLMGEKLDEEYSKVTNSKEWKEAMRIPFYLLAQEVNNKSGFNCVIAKKKEQHRKSRSRDFSSDEEDDDDVFYRGEVLSLHFESQTAQVLFYDYGFTETVQSDRIYFMDERFYSMTNSRLNYRYS